MPVDVENKLMHTMERMGGDMDTIQISSQWYVVRWEDDSRSKFTILSGPYSEEWWARSANRLNEI